MGSVFGHEVASCKSDGMPEKRTSGSFPEDNAAAEKNAAGETLGNRALSVCGRGPPHPPGISPGLPLRWLGRSRPAPAGFFWMGAGNPSSGRAAPYPFGPFPGSRGTVPAVDGPHSLPGLAVLLWPGNARVFSEESLIQQSSRRTTSLSIKRPAEGREAL